MKMRMMTLLIAPLPTVASGVAHATNVAANTGHAPDYAYEACMRADFATNGQGSVRVDGCTGWNEVLWSIELPVNSSGAKTVKVSGFSNYLGTQTKCTVRGMTEYGAVSKESGWVSFPKAEIDNRNGKGPRDYTLTITGASVPTNGRLQIQCTVGYGSPIRTINYSM